MKAITQKIVTVLLATIMGICMASAQTKTVKHTVERGETLASIAKRYGTTNDKIIELNPDASQFIYVGMELNIPVSPSVTNATYGDRLPSSGNPVSGYHPYTSNENDSEHEEGLHKAFVVAQYQLGDFREAKYTSCYGLGLVFPTIHHWGPIHVGANLNFSINAGIVDDWGCIIDFGPSVGFDIDENVFVNIPVDARCDVTFPEGSDTQTNWGMQIAPALHVFLTKKFGIFVGPQMTIGFASGSKPAFGLVAGLSYEF